MEKKIPLTYNIPFRLLNNEMRFCFLRELALNGAEHVVLGQHLFTAMMAEPGLGAQVASEMEKCGLTFKDAHAPTGEYWNLGSALLSERKSLLLRQKVTLETASLFNVRTVTMHMGKRAPELSEEAFYDLVFSALDELLPFAEERGIILCVENGYAFKGFPHAVLKVKEKFPVDSLGFCFDAGHANMVTHPETKVKNQEIDTLQILNAMLPHIVNCHIHDNDGMHDQHTLPGWGTADWGQIVSLLKKAPRLQVIQSEVNIPANGVAVRELVETFERLFR